MQCQLGMINDRHKKFPHQLCIVGAHPLGRDFQPIGQMGPPREIQGHLDQRFIQWGQKMAEPHDPLAIAQRHAQRHAQGNPYIFIRVVVVDVDVARRMDIQVKQAVGSDLVQHVVEEGDAGVDIALARTIEADRYGDIGFARFAVDGGAAGLGKCVGDLGAVSGLHRQSWPKITRIPLSRFREPVG